MHYSFPMIRHIDDVLPHIKDSPEFIVAERDDYIVINYMVAKEDTFPPIETIGDAIRRECRGIIFSKDGKVISRRFHKFFNYQEKEETRAIDLSKPHHILEKLDGSMIAPFLINGKVRFGTKMGITQISLWAEEFVAENPNYLTFSRVCLEAGRTPLFEFCSRKNRVVIDHPKDRLVLLALRDNESGVYESFKILHELGDIWSLDVVRAYPGRPADMQALSEYTKDLKNCEGFVVRFNDGHMAKVKSSEYLTIHRAKDNLTHEKNVIALIMSDKIDDLISMLPDEDAKKLERFTNQVVLGLIRTTNHLLMIREKFKFLSRKEFALNVSKSLPDYYASVLFHVWDLKDLVTFESVYRELGKIVSKNCGSQTSIDKIRHLWAGSIWNYGNDEG